MEGTAQDDTRERAERVEAQLAIPVMVAAAVSVPAVYMTGLGEPYFTIGTVLNWASLVLLAAESLLLLFLARNRWEWIRRHRWTLAITVVAVPAMVLAFAPMQALRLLRLLYMLATLQVLRANRIFKAGRVLARRLGLTGRWRFLPIGTGSVLAAGFIVLVLADPAASHRHQQVLEQFAGYGRYAPALAVGAAVAIIVLAFAMYRRRRRDADEDR